MIELPHQTRIAYYDILKGITMILVVLGHCMQSFSSTPKELVVPIYMFHMPLFMMISGYFIFPSINKYSIKQNIIRKTKHLYIPSLCWGFITFSIIALNKMLHHSTIDIIFALKTISNGMWFLTVLYILSIICIILKTLKGKYFIGIWSLIFVITFICPSYDVINEMRFLIPYFLTGIYLKKYNWSKLPIILLISSIFIYIVCLQFYTFDYTIYSAAHKDWLCKEELFKTIVRYLAGFSGSFIVIFLCNLFKGKSFITNYLIRIGYMTLPIYVIHQNLLFINRLVDYRSNNLLFLFIVSLIIIEVSLFLYKGTKDFRIGKFLYGIK